uniref:GRF-type domain-containing protein n=1 Tax=Davidia involucrata TaxID=16924 RepID=A0A5B7A5D7_DAVIN
MIALEHKETMQRGSEASMKCLQSKGFPYNLRCNGSPVEGFPEVKDEIYAHPGGDIVEPDRSLSSESLQSSIEFHKKPSYQHDFASWSTFHPDSNTMQQCQLNAFESQFFPVPVDNRLQYAPFNMFPQSYPFDYQFQDFQYFVVIDFEATCDKAKNPHPQEIIEFPSVIVSSMTGQLEACFQTYVRPTCNQLLSDFCKDLTGIQQIQVDRGVTLSEALLRHDKWLEKKGIKNTNFAVVTWSNWDCRVMLESECRYKKIRKPPYFNRWINLKVPFCEVFGGVRCNLKEAVQMAGLAWQGRAHCGLDDAKNTARLLAFLMHRGFKFSITSSLMYQSTDNSLTWKQPLEPLSFPPFHPQKLKDLHTPLIQSHPYCFCGVTSSKGMVRKPGPKQGSFFFGCGNWTVARGARCHYFEWASH